MTTVAVIGAGAGGLSSAVELSQGGHQVRLWTRNPASVDRYRAGVAHVGVFGGGSATADLVTTDMAAALAGAEVVVVCLPALAHASVFTSLARLGCPAPLVLNPGHTGGALHLREVFTRHDAALPPVAELSTLTYVARIRPDGAVQIFGRARSVRCGALPGGADAAKAAAGLFPGVTMVGDVLASSLSNVNLVLHPPGAILAAAWVEATGGAFTFYVDALTPGVARVIDRLDAERRAVAARFGHQLPSLPEEMALIGTAPAGLAARSDTAGAIRAGEANRTIRAPDSLQHRYYAEDFPYAVVPFLALADIAGVRTPVAAALLTVAGALVEPDLAVLGGRDATALGVADLDTAGLLRLVRG